MYISDKELWFIKGMAEAYAETVSRTVKPIASFDLVYDDNSKNQITVKLLVGLLKDIADAYTIKLNVRNTRREYKDEKDKITTRPRVEFNYYKDTNVLNEYLTTVKKPTYTTKYHIKLGKLFGYTDDSIAAFLK
jgi:hypothetical protein